MKIDKNIAISESGFLFNPVSGESFSVSQLGVEIINLLKEDKTFEEIKSQILEKYQVDETRFELDFHDFTGMLKSYGLIIENR